LILTSPPYLNIYSYTRENWIRLWLLGFKREGISNAIKLDDSHKYEQYKEFLIKFMNSAGKTLSDNGKLILVIGDVEGQYNFKTLWDEIKYNVHFEMVDNFQDNKAEYKSTRKNGTKAGKATRIDNICIFKKWK
jgi:DNA modification methylase